MELDIIMAVVGILSLCITSFGLGFAISQALK